jgi:hypothetical protein
VVENLVAPRRGAPGGAYAPRDVINAPEIKASIAERSLKRADKPDIAAWLTSHFYRQIIGNFKATEPTIVEVKSLTVARFHFKSKPVPEWVHARLGANTKQPSSLWWIDANAPEVLALEQRLLEFLLSRIGTSLEGKLLRVNCPLALSMWSTEHAAFEAKAAAGWIEHTPTAVREVWRGLNGVFVEMSPQSPDLRLEMAYESQMMRHCLGQFANRNARTGGYGERYASACEEGSMRIFSFRNSENHPKITLSAHVRENGVLEIDQIKGKQNRPPVVRYRDEIRGFLNSLSTMAFVSADAEALGLVRIRSGWCTVSEVTEEADQIAIACRSPSLVAEMPSPGAAVQWLVLAKQPRALHQSQMTAGVRRTLARASPEMFNE